MGLDRVVGTQTRKAPHRGEPFFANEGYPPAYRAAHFLCFLCKAILAPGDFFSGKPGVCFTRGEDASLIELQVDE